MTPIDKEKSVKKVKEFGVVVYSFGIFKIVAALLLVLSKLFVSDAAEYISIGSADTFFNFCVGIFYFFSGRRISKLHDRSRSYLTVIIILSGLMGVVNLLLGGQSHLSILLSMWAFYILGKFNALQVNK